MAGTMKALYKSLWGAVALVAVQASADVVMTREQDGAVFNYRPGKIRIQVCSERILKVTVTPGDAFSERKSLVVEREWKPTHWTLTEDGRFATIATPKMKVRVDMCTGKVAFFDAKGGVLLREPGPNARTFTPATLVDEPTFRVEQRFQLQPGEAFFGLGSHQQGAFNYAGQTVTLQQVNTVACNPVLVSNRGYGVLWDNASRTVVDLGDVSKPLAGESLLDKDKKPGGLTGEYFGDMEFKELKDTRQDAVIDFDWTNAPPFELAKDFYSVRWTGYVKTLKAGYYTFLTDTDDGARLWVNGVKLFDDWTAKPLVTNSGCIWLPANAVVPIKLEFFQNVGQAICRLRWRTPGVGSTVKWTSEVGDQIDYYVLFGPEMDQIVGAYRDATGQAPMYGKWAYGLWQCKERYKTQQELLDIAEGYRSRGIPLDNIVQDWFYWDPAPWGSHSLDPKRYPDFAGAVAELHDKYKLHVMISVWAKFAPGSANFLELDSKGLLFPKVGEDARYYDPFSAEGREIYWRQMKEQLFSKGVDAWWLDATEPEIDAGAFRDMKSALGYAGRYQNAFPLMTTKAVYEGQRQETDAKRVFILTRSVFAGQQRNAATTWSGDITANWDVFRNQIAGGLNFCMSGVPYWCTDIGAFFGGDNSKPEYRELFTRWFQWGAFCPIFRVHGTGTDKELWRFGPETEKALVKVDVLRYRLMPYIYSLAWRVTDDGYTMMRGLPMDFRRDPKTASVRDQLMFGPALMMSPVVKEKATSRTVYFPKGVKWFDFWTGQVLKGGRDIVVPAPIDSFPLHVRAGSILPMGPEVQYATEKPADPIELRVYTGADGYFELYEDENDGYGYEKGARAIIPIRWVEKTGRLYIGKRVGSFPGMLAKRTFRVVWVRPGRGTGIAPAKPDATVEYGGAAVTVRRR
jgi:alpha-D-xyloside xylohydrolase